MTMRRRRRLARWRRRWRALGEAVRRSLHLTRRGFRYLRWLAWTLAAGLLAFYGLFPNITWESEYARQVAGTAIVRTITREVAIGSARMNLLGDIVLREVTIRARDGENIPFLAYAPKIVVHLDYRPLARHTVQVASVDVHEPEVHMDHYLDGSWNTAGLFETGTHDTEPYQVGLEIDDGHYLLRDFRTDSPVLWDCQDVDGDVILNKHGEYTVTFDGDADVAGVAPLEYSGTVFVERGTVTMRAAIDRAPCAWTWPYLDHAGVRAAGGTLKAETRLRFQPDGYLCSAQITADDAGLAWQGVQLPPGDGTLELSYRDSNKTLAIDAAHLVRNDIDLTVRGSAGNGDYALTVVGNAFPLSWLPAVAGRALPDFEAAGTFAGELAIARTAGARSVRLQADLEKAAIRWSDLLEKPAGRALPLRLTAAAANDAPLRIDQVQVALEAGALTATPAADGGWGLSFSNLPVTVAAGLSPVLRAVLAEAGVTVDGSASGTLATGTTGALDLNLDAAAVSSAGFTKAAGVPLRLTGTYQRRPQWRLTASSWKLGESGGRLEYAAHPGGVWQLLVVAHTLLHNDLRALPRLVRGPLAALRWTGPLAGEISCTVDTAGQRYEAKVNGGRAELSYSDWLTKAAGMPFTAEVSAAVAGETLKINRAQVQAGGSVFRITGESDFAHELADFTVLSDRCQPAELRQLIPYWREHAYQFGAWDGAGKGMLRMTRSGETTDYVFNLDLTNASWEIEDLLRKERELAAVLQGELSFMPGRVLVKRGNLSVGRSKLDVTGDVVPSGDYQVALNLKTDIYAPEVNRYLLNLDQRRVVGYPATTLIDSLQDRQHRIDLEWQVRGTFAKPQFELEMRKAISEGLRNTIDNRFRSLGLLVEGTLRIGGKIIALPFNVLRIFTREEHDTRDQAATDAGTQPAIRQ